MTPPDDPSKGYSPFDEPMEYHESIAGSAPDDSETPMRYGMLATDHGTVIAEPDESGR